MPTDDFRLFNDRGQYRMREMQRQADELQRRQNYMPSVPMLQSSAGESILMSAPAPVAATSFVGCHLNADMTQPQPAGAIIWSAAVGGVSYDVGGFFHPALPNTLFAPQNGYYTIQFVVFVDVSKFPLLVLSGVTGRNEPTLGDVRVFSGGLNATLAQEQLTVNIPDGVFIGNQGPGGGLAVLNGGITRFLTQGQGVDLSWLAEVLGPGPTNNLPAWVPAPTLTALGGGDGTTWISVTKVG